MITRNFPHPPGNPVLLSLAERTGAAPHYAGRGVTIAVVDSGFYPHPDIADRIRLYVDATTRRIIERPLPTLPFPLAWHGQMTSVIAAGDGRMSGGRYAGLAAAANLILIKVSTRRGAIKEPDILRGLRWVERHAEQHHIRVVNVSLGGDAPDLDPQHPLHRVVRQLTAHGITVVIAAGNRMDAPLLPPASAHEAITVGGYDDGNTLDRACWRLYHHTYGHDTRQDFKPDVLAPAAWLPSPILPGTEMAREAPWLAQMFDLLPTQRDRLARLLVEAGDDLAALALTDEQRTAPDAAIRAHLRARIHAHKLVDAYHQHVDGTSVAAPIVASVVAQMIEANPRLTPARIKQVLMDTAEPLAGISFNRQGAGVIQPQQAVKAVSG